MTMTMIAPRFIAGAFLLHLPLQMSPSARAFATSPDQHATHSSVRAFLHVQALLLGLLKAALHAAPPHTLPHTLRGLRAVLECHHAADELGVVEVALQHAEEEHADAQEGLSGMP